MTVAFALKFLPILLPFALKFLKQGIEAGVGQLPNKSVPWISALLGAVVQALATGTVDLDALTDGATRGLAAVGIHQGTVFKATDPKLGGQSPVQTPTPPTPPTP